jgi:hypothetical protein
MPDVTPIYGFTYPCPDEVVGPLAFQVLANQIDSKLNDLAAGQTAALNRPNARRESASNIATNNVVQVTVGANSSFVIPTAGVWLVSAFVPSVGGAGALNEVRLRVRQNTTPRFGVTRNTTGGMTLLNTNCFGPLVCAVGDTIDTDFFYTGTLTVSYTVIMNLKMIVRIA